MPDEDEVEVLSLVALDEHLGAGAHGHRLHPLARLLHARVAAVEQLLLLGGARAQITESCDSGTAIPAADARCRMGGA